MKKCTKRKILVSIKAPSRDLPNFILIIPYLKSEKSPLVKFQDNLVLRIINKALTLTKPLSVTSPSAKNRVCQVHVSFRMHEECTFK